MAAVQRRAAPVITRLCQLGAEPGVGILAGRVSELLARRRENLSGVLERRNFLCEARERAATRRRTLHYLTSYRLAEASPRIKRLNAAV
jgi:hypothetical protein